MSDHQSNNIQYIREQYIRKLNSASNSTKQAQVIADDLFALDLTIYSNDYSLDSAIYSAFAESKLDPTISLHPEQIEIIYQIDNNDAIIISAPTSFGKTFCIFEYIAQKLPNNIVLVVPTLALVDEYVKRVIRKYPDFFSIYKVHTYIDGEKKYNYKNKNIFIITHDKVVQENAYQCIEEIDFLVIDEVYKLETAPFDDRVLVLNMAYYYLSQKAKKYVLLAPFIKSVEDIESLNKKPFFYNTNYSPVVNDVQIKEILKEKDRYQECQNLILSLIPKEEKTLIYFPTVRDIYIYINKYIVQEPLITNFQPEIEAFLKWAKDEIHEEWSIIKAMERGYLVHNGQLPFGTRMFQLDCYENDNLFNHLLCTSTLLEGVNTTAKNIIISKPSRKSDDNLSAFDFYNLVGRTGRLNKHFIGTAYYLKTPSDPDYHKNDAIKAIKFEITDDSKDIKIQKNDLFDDDEVTDFLNELNISIKDYLLNIGSRLRFETVLNIYNRFKEKKTDLLDKLLNYINEPNSGRLDLVKILYIIVENIKNENDPNMKFNCNIINQLLNRRRPKIKTIINNTKKYYQTRTIDNIIFTTIRMKMSYIEHKFYVKVLLIRYFLELSKTQKELINVLNEKIIHSIEFLYFSSSIQNKMLISLGIDERDVEKIIQIIGDDFDDIFELKIRLKNKLSQLRRISFISKYIIQELIR